MGGAQTTLCCCWERQKLPANFPPEVHQAPQQSPHANEPSDRRGQAEEDDKEVEFTCKTFLELRKPTPLTKRSRSRSVPRSLELCREQAPLVALAGNMEENAAEQPNQVPALHLLDHPFEPFLTYEMVSADRQWMRAVVGLMRRRDVPARPHACANTCTECCQLHNASWRVAACDAQRVPGQLCPCRDLDILPPLPEMPESPSSLEGRASN